MAGFTLPDDHTGMRADGSLGTRPSADKSRKSCHLDIRVTPPQSRAIRRVADSGGLTITNLILSRCLADELGMLPLVQGELRDLRHELNKQGVNLNQIAHRINLLNEPTDPRLDSALSDLRVALDEQHACVNLTIEALESVGITLRAACEDSG